MQREMQNGGATLSLLPTRGAKALTSRLPKRGSRRVIAIQDSQPQKGEAAVTAGASQPLVRTLLNSGFGIWDLGFPQAACLATGARKGRARKMGRTNRSCIARSSTIRH